MVRVNSRVKAKCDMTFIQAGEMGTVLEVPDITAGEILIRWDAAKKYRMPDSWVPETWIEEA